MHSPWDKFIDESVSGSVLAEPKFNRIVNCKRVLDILSVAIRTEVELSGPIGGLTYFLPFRFI